MKRLALLAALMGGMIAVQGCQQSSKNSSSDSSMAASTRYSYKVNRDADYMSSPSDTNASGHLTNGDVVTSDHEINTSDAGMAHVKLPNGTWGYVHASDLSRI